MRGINWRHGELAMKREKFGALTVIGKTSDRSPMMGKAEAQQKGMQLMSETITTYMQTHLSDQLKFSDEGQQNRFQVQLLGKSEHGSATIAGQSYNTTNTSINLTLYGVRELMSSTCKTSESSTHYLKLLAMPLEGVIETIDAAIKAFAEKDASPSEGLIDSWMQSELKAELMEQQQKYQKKFG